MREFSRCELGRNWKIRVDTGKITEKNIDRIDYMKLEIQKI